ncbi:MAG TPA: NEW3 domain-containing protein [Bacteroidota bacterium]
MKTMILILMLAVQSAAAQLLYNPNDERFKSLYLEKVQSDYKVQKDEFDRLNLPRQVTYDFLEAQTNARLSQVKFSQDVNTRKLALAVYLPDRYDSTSFPIDRPVSFFAAVVPRELADKIREERGSYTSEELDRMGLSYARLELLPRGVGRIQVQAANFYHEIRPAEAVQIMLTILNDGTRRLDNVKIRADAPLNWVAAVSPDLIAALDPGKEERVQVTIRPPADAGVGDYEATIKTESYADNRKVESEDKKIRIHLAASANLWGTAALVVLLGGILAGIVVFGVRLSRK